MIQCNGSLLILIKFGDKNLKKIILCIILTITATRALASDNDGDKPETSKLEYFKYRIAEAAVGAAFSVILAPYHKFIDRYLYIPEAAIEKNFTFYVNPSNTESWNSLVFSLETEAQLKSYVRMFETTASKKQKLPNLLLYGPPGTGKTEFAKRFIKKSGKYNYMIFSGSSFMKFEPARAIEEFSQIFRAAKRWKPLNKKPTILFFDEVEILFKARDKNHGDTLSQKLLNEFLAVTGDKSEKFAIIAATNMPQMVDRAVKRRFQFSIEIPNPGETETVRVISYYLYQTQKIYKNIKIDIKFWAPKIMEILKAEKNQASPVDIKDSIDIAVFNASVRVENTLELSDFQKAIFETLDKYNTSVDYLSNIPK